MRRCSSRPLLVCIGLEAWTEEDGGRAARTDAVDGRAACGAAQTCGCRGEHMRARLRHGALRSSSSSGAVLGVLEFCTFEMCLLHVKIRNLIKIRMI